MPQISNFRQTNEMSEIAIFISTWSSERLVASPDEVQRRTSRFGNINIDGSALGGYARTLTVRNPLFFTLIEPAVRPLVMMCTEELDLITYTSCEGHSYPDDSLNSELHVGILPRSVEEYQLVLQVFGAVLHRANPEVIGAQFAVVTGDVIDRATGDNWPAIDIYLVNRGEWTDYYEHRVDHVSKLIGVLRQLAAESDGGQ